MSPDRRKLLIAGACVVVVVALVLIVRSLGLFGSETDKYAPAPGAFNNVTPGGPQNAGRFTPYGQKPRPGEIRPAFGSDMSYR